jgi:predicted ATPase/DNA-binding CsgD family transcriptional regulator
VRSQASLVGLRNEQYACISPYRGGRDRWFDSCRLWTAKDTIIAWARAPAADTGADANRDSNSQLIAKPDAHLAGLASYVVELCHGNTQRCLHWFGMRNTKPTTNAAEDLGSGSLSGSPTTSPESTYGSALTRREHEVLELMALGLTNKEIAQRLALGRRTVESHIDHVLGKLNAPSRTRAVAEAGRAGLLGRAPDGPADSQTNNLPFQLTPLVGREQDLADVKSLLEGNRLVTLMGSGGVGKTRLALRVGIDLIDRNPNGVWFCDFSSFSGPELVVGTVAKVLAVRGDQSRSLAASIAQTLRHKRALLILDNCEHVLDKAAELSDEILHQCPNIRILATSRQTLGIIGEFVYRVRSLAFTAAGADLKADQAMRYGAIELFTDRARASDATFALTDDNAPTVAEICRRLDGIPLAIELAATRINVVNVLNLAQSLDDRFRVLTAGSRTALPRHKTLTALIDWSYDLLSPLEQKLFDQLGIFAGGFSLKAATAVSGTGSADESDVQDILVALADKSLVVVQTAAKQERYTLLDSMRAYAVAKLASKGELDRLARLRSEYFRDQAKAADESYGLGSTAEWLADEELDLENYRATLAWALTDGHDAALGASLAGSLERLWALEGQSIEARLWLDTAFERIDEAEYPAIAARLWRAKARFVQGQPMRDCAERALILYESIGDGKGAAHALRSLAYSLLQMGRLDEADQVIAKAIASFRDHGDKVGVASCLGLQGVTAYNSGDFAKGREFYVQALMACRELGDDLAVANVLGNLGELEFADGRVEQALWSVSESLKITSLGKLTTDLAIDHNNSAAYRIALGSLDEARESACAALGWAQPEHNEWNIAVSLQHLALLAALRGKTRCATQLLGYVNAQYKKLALEREVTEKWGYEKLMIALRDQLNENQIRELEAAGADWSEERAVEEALKT